MADVRHFIEHVKEVHEDFDDAESMFNTAAALSTPELDKGVPTADKSKEGFQTWVKNNFEYLAERSMKRKLETSKNESTFARHLGTCIYSLAAIALSIGCIYLVNKIYILKLAANGHWIRSVGNETLSNIKKCNMNNASFPKKMGLYVSSFAQAVITQASNLLVFIPKAGKWLHNEVNENANKRLKEIAYEEQSKAKPDPPLEIELKNLRELTDNERKSFMKPRDNAATQAKERASSSQENTISFGQSLGVYFISIADVVVTGTTHIIASKYL